MPEKLLRTSSIKWFFFHSLIEWNYLLVNNIPFTTCAPGKVGMTFVTVTIVKILDQHGINLSKNDKSCMTKILLQFNSVKQKSLTCWWFECCGFGWRDNGASGAGVQIATTGGTGTYCGSLAVWWRLSGGAVWVSPN